MGTKKTIVTLGSCVSRDIFNLVQDRYSVVLNIQRNSIKTMFGEKFDISDEILDGVGNGWNERMLRYNCGKSIPEILGGGTYLSDYIVLDYVDDRFNIFEFEYNGRIIRIPQYLASTKLFDINKDLVSNLHILKLDELSDGFIGECVNNFVEMLLKNYKQEQIIINEFYLLENYVDSNLNICKYNGLNVVKTVNAHIKKLYEKTKEALPKCHVIKMPGNTFGDPENRWGLASTHANKAFYAYALSCLDIICGYDFSNTLEQRYNVQCRENLFYKEQLNLLKSVKD